MRISAGERVEILRVPPVFVSAAPVPLKTGGRGRMLLAGYVSVPGNLNPFALAHNCGADTPGPGCACPQDTHKADTQTDLERSHDRPPAQAPTARTRNPEMTSPESWGTNSRGSSGPMGFDTAAFPIARCTG